MIVISTLEAITAALNDGDSKQDFLFYTTSFYAKSLATGFLRPRHLTIQTAVLALIEALRNYRTHIGSGNPSLAKILDIPDFSNEEWWKFLGSRVAKSVHTSETSPVKKKDPFSEPILTGATITELVKHPTPKTPGTETSPHRSLHPADEREMNPCAEKLV